MRALEDAGFVARVMTRFGGEGSQPLQLGHINGMLQDVGNLALVQQRAVGRAPVTLVVAA
jgi:hypothetical protein